MDTTRDAERPQARTVLVLGEYDRAEMRPLLAWLRGHVENDCQLLTARDAVEFTTEFVTDEFPDLIVIFQSWPDQFSSQEVADLLARAPLARIVVCYGAWCESDGRNRHIWPKSICVPVWSAKSRIACEWNLIQQPGEQQAIPWSASPEEVFVVDHPPISLSPNPQSVLIDSPDPSYRCYLVELVNAAGHLPVQVNPTVLLFDADPWGIARHSALETLCRLYPHIPIFALANLIQPPLTEELSHFGVIAVRSKLGGGCELDLTDLSGTVTR